MAPGSAAAAPQRGNLTFDVYRPGVYSMQATWTWCTAASVQIIRNILLDQADHSSAQQGTFFAYMRAANRYQQPGHRAVDPQGFLTGLRHFVDPSYALVASPTFNAAVRSAVTELRRTGEPVALIVAAGRHAWVLTGFTATADPARTTSSGLSACASSARCTGGRASAAMTRHRTPACPTRRCASSCCHRFRFATTPWTGRYARSRLSSCSSRSFAARSSSEEARPVRRLDDPQTASARDPRRGRVPLPRGQDRARRHPLRRGSRARGHRLDPRRAPTRGDLLGPAVDIPVVATLDEALPLGPTALLIGIAPTGGRLPATWRSTILRAIDAGLDVLSGLHTFVSDDPEFVVAALAAGVELVDYRRPPERMDTSVGRLPSAGVARHPHGRAPTARSAR